jgi:type VI protein secretion system component Hcp
VAGQGSSSELVELTQLLAQGTHIKSAELEIYAAGIKGELKIVDEFKFEDLLVSNWSTDSGSSDNVTHSLSFAFAKIEYGHQLYNANGAESGFTGSHDPVADIDFL